MPLRELQRCRCTSQRSKSPQPVRSLPLRACARVVCFGQNDSYPRPLCHCTSISLALDPLAALMAPTPRASVSGAGMGAGGAAGSFSGGPAPPMSARSQSMPNFQVFSPKGARHQPMAKVPEEPAGGATGGSIAGLRPPASAQRRSGAPNGNAGAGPAPPATAPRLGAVSRAAGLQAPPASMPKKARKKPMV